MKIDKPIAAGLFLGLLAAFALAATPIKDLVLQGTMDAAGNTITNLGVSTNLTSAATRGYVNTNAANTNYQPADADLTDISALTTTSAGRSLLTSGSLTATGLGLTNGATIDAWGAISPSSKLNADRVIGSGTVQVTGSASVSGTNTGDQTLAGLGGVRATSGTANNLTVTGTLDLGFAIISEAPAFISSPADWRSALGIGTAGIVDTGTAAGQVPTTEHLGGLYLSRTESTSQSGTATLNVLNVNGATTIGDAAGDTLAVNPSNPNAPNLSTLADATTLVNRRTLDDRSWIYSPTAPWIREFALNAGWLAATSLGGTMTQNPSSLQMFHTGTVGSGSFTAINPNSFPNFMAGPSGMTMLSGPASSIDFATGQHLFSSAVSTQVSSGGSSAFYGYYGSPVSQSSPVTAISQGVGFSITTTSGTGTIRLTAKPNTSTVTAVSNATPIVVSTSAAHGVPNGQLVEILNAGGNTAANGIWSATSVTGTTFALAGSVGNGAYTSGASWHFTSTALATFAPTNSGVFNIIDIITQAGTASLYLSGTLQGTLSYAPTTKITGALGYGVISTGTQPGYYGVYRVRSGYRP